MNYLMRYWQCYNQRESVDLDELFGQNITVKSLKHNEQ